MTDPHSLSGGVVSGALAAVEREERCVCHVCGSDDSVINCESCDLYACHEHATYSGIYGVRTCAPMWPAVNTTRHWCDSTPAERAEERRRLEELLTQRSSTDNA